MIVDDSGDRRTLFLFRHGETDWNREGRMQGQTDTPLNATGLAQAEALAHRLRAHQLDAIVSSDLSRALTTAQIVADAGRFRRYGSARRLYNFHIDHAAEY